MAAAGKPVRAPRKKVNPLHAKRIKEVDWKDVTLLRVGMRSCGTRVDFAIVGPLV